ncbi:hypothetical protein QF118_17510 [Tropicibacter oceani]|uniref:Uncharacterized protein n=1 Tax=Tropicibacter oceani TaxID=3058420 RepID=A0ABY8QIA0_9RHOB|nr:hypothetical protein [Tropicibacter oceani]WGW03693.1 hypothetical protein QF118_17510 [Tropicibacter oceani]
MDQAQDDRRNAHGDPEALDKGSGQVEFLRQRDQHKRGGKDVSAEIQDAVAVQDAQRQAGIQGDIGEKSKHADNTKHIGADGRL